MYVQTNDYSTYDNYTVTARLSAQDEYSDIEDKNIVYDQFTIEIRDECHDIVTDTAITVFKSSATTTFSSVSSPFTFDMWEQQDMRISPIVFKNGITNGALAHTKCPTTYHITDINMERTEIYGNDYSITPNDKSGGE